MTVRHAPPEGVLGGLELLAEALAVRATNSRFVKKTEKSALLAAESALLAAGEALLAAGVALLAAGEAKLAVGVALLAAAEAMLGEESAMLGEELAIVPLLLTLFFPSTLSCAFAKRSLTSLLRFKIFF